VDVSSSIQARQSLAATASSLFIGSTHHRALTNDVSKASPIMHLSRKEPN